MNANRTTETATESRRRLPFPLAVGVDVGVSNGERVPRSAAKHKRGAPFASPCPIRENQCNSVFVFDYAATSRGQFFSVAVPQPPVFSAFSAFSALKRRWSSPYPIRKNQCNSVFVLDYAATSRGQSVRRFFFRRCHSRLFAVSLLSAPGNQRGCV